ncbi:MAG: hypothetical protein ACLFTK_17390 [Anaerolineales bacterium]
MPETYDIYGFRTYDLENVASELCHLVGRLFISRRCVFLGRTYQAGDPRGENFDLLHNHPGEADSDWLEPNFKQFGTILYVNRTHRAAELESAIAETFGETVALLARQTYDEKLCVG